MTKKKDRLAFRVQAERAGRPRPADRTRVVCNYFDSKGNPLKNPAILTMLGGTDNGRPDATRLVNLLNAACDEFYNPKPPPKYPAPAPAAATNNDNDAHPTIQGLVININGTITPVKLSCLEDFQKAVGGYIQLLALGNHSAYVNEDGKVEHKPYNGRATKLCHSMSSISLDDFIVGPLLIVGPGDKDGWDTSVDPLIAAVLSE